MWDVVIDFQCCVLSLCGYKDSVLVLYVSLLIKRVYEVAQLDCLYSYNDCITLVGYNDILLQFFLGAVRDNKSSIVIL